MDKIVSSGYKFDLHIHSCFSKNKDKDRVQNNTAANIQVLLNKLEENQVNICAITDHDVFNYGIYRKLKANEGQGELKKVLPGVEFSVSFKQEGTEKVVHVVTIFDDMDDIKVKNIEKVLGKQQYDGDGAFSEELYFKLLREIDLDTIMIAHQKNTLTSKAKAKKDDVLALGEDKFNEFLFLDYFQAYEFRNKKNQLYNKTYIDEKQLEDNLRMLTGSDCHDWNYYPRIDKNDKGSDFAFSYCKCLPTFKGLMMAVTDSRRIMLENSFFNPNAKVEETIKIQIDQRVIDIPLSKGINVIIGDNSIGKSLLLHAITNYRQDCSAKLRTGYSKYLREKKVTAISTIADEKLFKCDMQGQIRKQFEEGAIKGSEFLSQFFPPDIDVREPRSIIDQELDKIYNHLQAKFDYDKKITNLSFFTLVASEPGSQSLTIVGKIPEKKTEGFEQIVADIKEINRKLAKLLKKKELEDEDKETIEKYLVSLQDLETKYAQKIKEINNENLIRNTIGSILQEFKTKYSHHTSDEQKKISSFLASKEDVVNEIYELVKKHNESKKPVITIPTSPIQPNESAVYKYKFVSKLNIDSISQEYFYSLFKKVLKKNTKLDFEKMTSAKLKERILHYPADVAQPLEALKQKIEEILHEDFSSRHSIIEKGMDRYKELSAGFNSQIYFSILATENKKAGIYVVDQPEDNISQKSIRETVLDDIKEIGYNRQVIMVTHNPQFIVNLDVDNVLFITVNEDNTLQIKSGALEYECEDYAILDIIAENVDGGLASIEKRLKRYEKRIQTEA